MRAAAAACKTNEIGARECSSGKQHLGCSLALLLLPNLSLPLRFSSLLLPFLLLSNLSLPLRFISLLLALLLLPNLSLPLRFSSLLLALLLLQNLSLPLRFSGAFTFDGLQRLLG
jgi:hypothetical protein